MPFDPLAQYLTELRQLGPLEQNRTVQLLGRIRAGIEATNRLNAGVHPPDERDRLAEVSRDGEQAKQDLVQGNLRLVVAAALRHPDVTAPLLDLIQEGNIGLIQAVEQFDPDQGETFEAFAERLIVEAISTAAAERGSS